MKTLHQVRVSNKPTAAEQAVIFTKQQVAIFDRRMVKRILKTARLRAALEQRKMWQDRGYRSKEHGPPE